MSHVDPGIIGDHPTPRCPLQQAFSQQVGFDLVFQCIRRNVHRVGDGLHARRSTGKNRDDGFDVLAVELFQSAVIDALHFERLTRYTKTDGAVAASVGKVTRPAKPVIGLSRRSARSQSDFPGGVSRALGQTAHFTGDDGEASTLFTGTGGFHSSILVEGADACATSDFSQHLTDLGELLINLVTSFRKVS